MITLPFPAVSNYEIDALGHLNNNRYLARVCRSSAALFEWGGVTADELRSMGGCLRVIDTYSNFHREQFAGATLEMQGGMLEVAPDRLRAFYEVQCPAEAAPAATFILTHRIVDPVTDLPIPLSIETRRQIERTLISLPHHGAPRSVSLTPHRTDLTYEQIYARVGGAAELTLGGLHERAVEASACDEYGLLRSGEDMLFSRKERGHLKSSRATGAAVVHLMPDGSRIGWPLKEKRTVIHRTPRLGDTLRIIEADVAHGPKTRWARRWAFDRNTGALAISEDLFTLCVDLDTRRALPIPDIFLESLGAIYAPEFR